MAEYSSKVFSSAQNPLPHGGSWSRRATAAGADFEFGRFRVLLRRRQLLADGVPVELGTRAFDILLVLLEADGTLVAKEELMSWVWPGIVVSEDNIKVRISALRKALGADCDLIHTEFGRGYRVTGVLRSDAAEDPGRHPMRSRAGCGPIFYAELSAVALVQCQFGRKFQLFPARPRARRSRQHASAFSKLIQPGRKARQAPLPKFRDAAGRTEPSATDRSDLSCKGEETWRNNLIHR